MTDFLGVQFGDYHTWKDWGLYLMGPASISLPVPKTNYVEVPGRNGYLDLSTALTGEIAYQTRDFSVPMMSLASPEEWPELYSTILNAIHGQEVQIVLDEDKNFYYTGRVAVESPSYDGAWMFNITGVLSPYKLRVYDTTVTKDLTTKDKTITLFNGRMPVVPSITVDTETTITFGSGTATLAAGTHKLLGVRLTEGDNTMKAKVTSGTGSITFTYREGSL